MNAQRFYSDADGTELVIDRASDEPSPLDQVLNDEEAAAVRIAFARLDPAEQELLELRVVSRLSAEEVASVIGKRPGAVRTAQSRAEGSGEGGGRWATACCSWSNWR